MAITSGQDAEASDFIDEAERNATPANDEGRVPKLEADGKLHDFFTRNGFEPNAGATINGATLPVPVMQNKTDNEVYACDANDTSLMKYIGFAVSNSTDANPIFVRTGGIVGGFSALDEGEKYYVQDAVGTIGTTAGTQEILVGIAISTTEILIMKGGRSLNGVATLGDTATTVITTGFRPSKIRIHAVFGAAANTISKSDGGWDANGDNKCVFYAISGSGADQGSTTSYAWILYDSAGTVKHRGIIDTITDTSFRINHTEVDVTGSVTYLFWEAEGEL